MPNSSNFFTANQIRRTFLDYFSQNGHSYVRSSPVKPFGDQSLEFVNAGMNQFKNVFLGLERVPFKRASNTQKCIRVGGKHNDLNSVGHDSYHHTFFEMLGNWSFNDYFKEEACRLAWALVTNKPFDLNPKRLYVTYFGGDEKSNLKPDLETKEIWMKIGVHENRILPFGLKDNFWEMGLHGPCGPCTEIHYDHLGTHSRPEFVNSGVPDLTELWNLVFIQYNRLEDGKLEKLSRHFVDTGMGLERLVALLQGKSSNYDTDLFHPYFSAISKLSGCKEYSGKFFEDDNGLDTAYRILADHARMITIAVADNIFPDQSHGLRRVIRKALFTAEKLMPGKAVNLLVELCKIAGDSFAEIFPETIENQKQIEFVIKNENEVWEMTKSKVKSEWRDLIGKYPELETLSDVQSPGLIAAIKEFRNWKRAKGAALPRELTLILYDRYGLTPQVIEQLATIFGYTLDLTLLEKDIATLKENNKMLMYSSKSSDIPQETIQYIVDNFHQTNDSFKLNYTKNNEARYCFESIKSKVNAIILNGKLVNDLYELPEGSNIALLLEKTNMWSTFKGDTDIGSINLSMNGNPVAQMVVDRVLNVQGYIYHFGTLNFLAKRRGLLIEDLEGEVFVNSKRRLNLMRNTTAVHLIDIVLRENFVSTLNSMVIREKDFSANFTIYGQILTDEDIKLLEKKTNDLINEGIKVQLSSKSTNAIVDMSDVSIPCFVNYKMNELQIATFSRHNGLRKVTVGPNVLNTRDVEDVCLVKVERKNRSRDISISGVTGENVKIAKENAQHLISILSTEVSISPEQLRKAKNLFNNNYVPWEFYYSIDTRLQELKSILKKKESNKTIDSLKDEILAAEKTKRFLVLYVGEELKLEKILDSSLKIPLLLFGVNQKKLIARCFVPEDCRMSAKKWMAELAEEFEAEARPSRNQDPRIYTIKPVKLPNDQLPFIITKFKHLAEKYAEKLLMDRQV